jgi:hypothetical protein
MIRLVRFAFENMLKALLNRTLTEELADLPDLAMVCVKK